MHLDHLLTIGQLGKLSNIHTKALRYYEQIGILTPTKINPGTGYRYYSYAQIPYVKMIKLCAQYGIRLDHFKNFLKEDAIDLSQMLSLAQEKIKQKLVDCQADLSQIERLQERLNQAQIIDEKGHVSHHEEEQLFWSLPFSGNIFDKSYYKLLSQALIDLQAVSCQTQHKIGLYYDLTGNGRGNQLIIQITDHHKLPDRGSVLCLPSGSYTSQHVGVKDISQFLTNLSTSCCLIFETYEHHYELEHPHVEISYPDSLT